MLCDEWTAYLLPQYLSGSRNYVKWSVCVIVKLQALTKVPFVWEKCFCGSLSGWKWWEGERKPTTEASPSTTLSVWVTHKNIHNQANINFHVLDYTLLICGILVCLQKNIVHRDLKLGNMILNRRYSILCMNYRMNFYCIYIYCSVGHIMVWCMITSVSSYMEMKFWCKNGASVCQLD